MNPIVDFKALPERIRSAGKRVKVAVASPADSHTEEVIERSIRENFAQFTLVAVEGKQTIACRLAADYPEYVHIIMATDDDDAARLAVKEVREERAQVLMKGSLNTDNLLRAVLNKEQGIMVKGSVLTHIAVAEIPGMNRLLFFSDAAVIPFPTTEQLDAVTTYITQTWRSITGGDKPRVALTHCTEKTSEKFPITLSYQEVKQYAAEGKYGDICIDGPMDVKTACDAESGAIKGIASPVVVDEMMTRARYTGLPFMKRESIFHALNAKAAARRYAKTCGKVYENMDIIVAHLGGGICVSAHHLGKVIDVNNALNGDGPIAPERSGTLPADQLVRLCFSGKYKESQIMKMLAGYGGCQALLGIKDMKEISRRAEAGEEPYHEVLEAMLYTISKQIGAMAVALWGKAEAIILTGGIAYSKYCVEEIKKQVDFLAPVVVLPGEGEMESLAFNALGALTGELPIHEYK